MSRKLEVGMNVVLRPVNNAARYNKEPKECKITKVGRKYFEVGNTKFNVSDLSQVTNYSASWVIYFSMQEYNDAIEKEKLSWELRRFFDGYGNLKLSLDQLRQVKKIIDSTESCSGL